MTREEWRKRPLAERIQAFTTECERKYGTSPHPRDFGIDPALLDAPGDDRVARLADWITYFEGQRAGDAVNLAKGVVASVDAALVAAQAGKETK